jgi:hypothetical protein
MIIINPTIIRELGVSVLHFLYIYYMILENLLDQEIMISLCCLDFQKRENMGVPRGRIEGIKEKKFKNKGIKKSPNSPLDRFRLLKDLYLTT